MLNCIHHQRETTHVSWDWIRGLLVYPDESKNVGTTVVWLLQDLSTQPQPPVPTFTWRLTLRSSTPSTMTLTARPSQHLPIRKTTVRCLGSTECQSDDHIRRKWTPNLATSPLSRGTLKSQGGGKLSVLVALSFLSINSESVALSVL